MELVTDIKLSSLVSSRKALRGKYLGMVSFRFQPQPNQTATSAGVKRTPKLGGPHLECG